MKTVILLPAFFLFLSSFSHAQIEKGRMPVGGSFGFYRQKFPFSTGSVTNVTVSPSLGTFYKTNRAIGGFISVNYNENGNLSNGITRNYGAGLFLRQYYPVVNKLYFFFGEQGSYSFQHNNQDSFFSKGYSINVSLQPGMAYDLGRKWQVELSMNNFLAAGYSRISGVDSYYLSSSLDGSLLNNVNFGFRYYLK